MNSLADIDDALNKAFRLASFIHGSKETALRVVSRAMARLEVAASAQGKRLYYRPAGRSPRRQLTVNGLRSKVSYSELHLLQRLVYIESEPYEKQKEQAGGGSAINEEDLLIHFIKHLVRITLKRNSFYATLGLCRLLYNYSTAETMEIYNVVVQDPERVKDDYYYRSRKGVLMQELKDRFGDFVRVSRGHRGEERFEADSQSGRFVELVRECLSLFTPWDTPCPIPAGFAPLTDGIPPLSYEGGVLEDQVEVNRMHAVLHPDCYLRLIAALGFAPLDQRLEVPQFFLSNNKDDRGGGDSDRHRPSELKSEELDAIKEDLAELASRRKTTSAEWLRVMVDGVDRARLDLKRGRRVQLGLKSGSESIEIHAPDKDGDILLALHLLTYDDRDEVQSSQAFIVLEGGQKLSISVSPSEYDSSAVVRISYQETNPVRTAALVLRRIPEALTAGYRIYIGEPNLKGRSGSRILIPALTSLLLVVCVAAVIQYIQRREPRLERPPVASTERTPPAGEQDSVPDGEVVGTSPATEASPPQASPVRKQNATRRQRAASPASQVARSAGREGTAPQQDQNLARQPAPAGRQATEREGVASGEDITRGLTGGAARVSLLDVERVWVELPGDDPFSQGVRKTLVKELQASRRFTPVENRDEADALLRVTVTRARVSPPKGTQVELASPALTAQLINANGDVVWSAKNRQPEDRYRGLTPAQVGTKIVQDLIDEIERLKRTR